ncbi:hypothetical protein LU631_17785 [Erwinia tracheiphila]|uniref:hypothetical protein n=1 Tax=Erwinia tracheiphila TaxID=65700 RepID=UPI00033B4E54|nr:hypothetical protein [Erwinia tracheiphila]EOS96362.1 hypothetical protein ETR_02929 [Erwinia tracheiphila PSU-1]UIA86716.1 hypothetical protein LU631_17785 [Erwinia tracheiphila]UIA95072.1 hypothetical protein LU633_16245 [Erwinia tracheiphila]
MRPLLLQHAPQIFSSCNINMLRFFGESYPVTPYCSISVVFTGSVAGVDSHLLYPENAVVKILARWQDNARDSREMHRTF